MWIVGAYGVLAGSNAAITIGTTAKRPATEVLKGQPVEQEQP